MSQDGVPIEKYAYEPPKTQKELDDWISSIQQRNIKMEVKRSESFDEQLAHDDAERLYSEVKDSLKKMSTRATFIFWLKIYWFGYWNAWDKPDDVAASAKEEVLKLIKSRELGNGWIIAHVPRPWWIKPPPGGDDFDNGKSPERLRIPY